ncbi:hypothetical protein LAA29_140105 [Leuconostoc carnosum]|nr:hypothetical protein LCAC16_240105 [Leuconostoc carnosum]SPO33698.1 hypothetical protein LAA29_140105 [Leuconostoc carnosum]
MWYNRLSAVVDNLLFFFIEKNYWFLGPFLEFDGLFRAGTAFRHPGVKRADILTAKNENTFAVAA